MNRESYQRRCVELVLGAAVGTCLLLTALACQSEKVKVDEPITAYRDRISSRPRLAARLTSRPAVDAAAMSAH